MVDIATFSSDMLAIPASAGWKPEYQRAHARDCLQCHGEPPIGVALPASAREVAEAVRAGELDDRLRSGGSPWRNNVRRAWTGRASKVSLAERYRSKTERTMMRKIKRALDPDGRLNPGKMVTA